MPAILAALGFLLLDLAKKYLPTVIGRLLLAFGLTMGAMNVVVPDLLAFLQSQINGMPSLIVAYIGALGIDWGASLIVSALAANAVGRVFLKLKG